MKNIATSKKRDPICPGEILRKEFMEPLGISQNKLARDIDVPVTRISDIVHGRRGISADSALRLAVYFGTTPEFWLNLQTRYDLKISRRDLLPAIEKNVRPLQAVS
jgi:antitoxin HigA-1